jgi:methionine synthase II (cobalamin-independent)
MATKQINKNITIEDLVTEIPESINYLMKEGIRCIRCGEPIWGTLESAAIEKGFNQDDIERFVRDINEIANNSNLNIANLPKINVDKIN